MVPTTIVNSRGPVFPRLQTLTTSRGSSSDSWRLLYWPSSREGLGPTQPIGFPLRSSTRIVPVGHGGVLEAAAEDDDVVDDEDVVEEVLPLSELELLLALVLEIELDVKVAELRARSLPSVCNIRPQSKHETDRM